MSDVPKKRRYGPAPLPLDQVRGRRVSVYLSDAEHELLESRAGEVGLRLPAYMRDAALDRLPPMIPALNREAWVALSRAAGNLHQVSRRLNVGGDVQVEAIRAALDEFRDALMGRAVAQVDVQEVEDEGENC